VKVNYAGTGLRILDFDCEVRPLSYLGADFTTGEVTGIACAWIVNGKAKDMQCWLLGEVEPWDMLESFRARYDEADMVTGHYIRGFDLTVLNGAMLDNNLPPLSTKLTHDTKNDLRRIKYMSQSQENLAAALGVKAPKVLMNQMKWRDANRLTPEGLALTRKRVVGDVKQHVQLREELLRRGWLGKPKVWSPQGSFTGAYRP
jgi:hypothetical protein